MAIERWHGVPGEFGFEVLLVDGKAYNNMEQALPMLDHYLLADGELVIEFKSSGYYDSGRTYGDPYNCYPPEGDDERTLVNAYIEYGPELPIRRSVLPKEVQQQLFDMYAERIQETELLQFDPPEE